MFLVEIQKKVNKLILSIFDLIFPLNPLSKEMKEISLEEFKERQFPKERRIYDFVFYLFNYKEEFIEQAIWELKFNKNQNIAKVFACFLNETINKKFGNKEVTLIAIPISKQKKNQKGFNHTELICQEISKINSNIKYEEKILIKNKNTLDQKKTKNKIERENNLKNSFSILNPEKIFNKEIILIDDVVTTGSTLREARKILLESGANSVIAFVVTH